MQAQIDKIIQKDADANRDFLAGLFNNPMLGQSVSAIYVYSLAEDKVNYPDADGSTIYIGECRRDTGPTGKRFAQHISTSETRGGDSGTIYSLSRYYWLGKKLRLRIFVLGGDLDRKALEKQLLQSHVKKYGALPICQGTTGRNYTVSNLATLCEANWLEL